MVSKFLIDKAIVVAQKSNVARAKLGAVLFTSRGQIITFASNKRYETKEHKKFTIHAEEAVIAKALKLKARQRYGKINILVVRWMSGKQMLDLAKPCSACMILLKMAKIDNIFYSNKIGNIEKL